MQIVIVGASGQLGTALSKLARPIEALSHGDLELTDFGAVNRCLSRLRPDCVINAAAYNFVDRAEEDPTTAFAVNALAPRNLAMWCRDAGARLVQVSTDYVFGLDATRSEPYAESDLPGPLGAYAVSKLAGEQFVRALCPRHFVVRTCGLYGAARSAGKGNFVRTVLRLAGERKELTIVDDQRCTPSFARDVAAAIVDLLPSTEYGLYHATNTGSATWYEFACEIARLAHLDVAIKPISSVEYPQKARRPGYSVLNCRKLNQAIGRTLPDWKDGLARYVAELKSPGAIAG